MSIWQEKTNGEKLHNRYLLTDLGGVALATGFGQMNRSHNETDDLFRLGKEEHFLRLNSYGEDSSTFDLVKRFSIQGSL